MGAMARTGTGGPRRRSINEILFSRRRWRRPFNFRRRRRHFIFFRLRTGRRAATRRRHTFLATRCTGPALPSPGNAQSLHSLHHRRRRRRRSERFGAASAREKMQIRREFYRRGPTPPPTPPLPLAIGTRRRQRRQTGRRRAVRARGTCSTRRQRKAQLNSATTRSATPVVCIYMYVRQAYVIHKLQYVHNIHINTSSC